MSVITRLPARLLDALRQRLPQRQDRAMGHAGRRMISLMVQGRESHEIERRMGDNSWS